jgi:gliding motility-associated-like protein
MKYRCLMVFSSIFISFHFFNVASGQGGVCPPNIDFELGNFNGWECNTGNVSIGTGGINFTQWNLSGQMDGRHTLIPASNTELDPYGLFPKSCPNGSGFSIQLGNDNTGSESEGLSFTYMIPANATKFSLIYHYAIVLQNPGHAAEEQPRFRAKVFDELTNQEINCVSFDFTASSNLPGFLPSPRSNEVLYKDWTPITVDLGAYAGRQVRLEFITSDCTRSGHFGYAYIDVGSNCNGAIAGSYQCIGDNFINLNAPYGFRTYSWYADNTFSQVIGTSQSLLLNPTPPLGSVIPVIITPFPGFGCEDTLYATISGSSKPVSIAGADRIICSKDRTQLGTANTPDYLYSWTPASMLNNPTLSNPIIKSNLLVPTEFIVKTTDKITSCFTQDTVLISPKVVDTASNIIGKMEYCPGDQLNNQLNVLNSSTAVQWRLNNSVIAGATALSYRPAIAGVYWAEIRQNGCTDTTRLYNIKLIEVPKVAFNLNRPIQCLTGPVKFINKTTYSGMSSLIYNWVFEDGTTSNDFNPTRSFTNLGNNGVKLIATTPEGCKDSLQKIFYVMKDCGVLMPSGFTPNRDGLNDVIRPNLAGVKALKRFSVYNRSGQLVFSTTKENEGWDGSYNGLSLGTAVFVWVVEYITDDDQSHMQKGTFTLIK